MKISLNQFNGLLPRVNNSALPENYCQDCDNIDLLSGVLQGKYTKNTESVIAGPVNSIAKLQGDWYSWVNQVNLVENPIFQDQYKRVFLTGNGYPEKGVYDTSYTFSRLGIPTPTETLVSTVNVRNVSTDWRRNYFYYWEDSDGKVTNRTLIEVTEDIEAKHCYVSIPPDAPTTGWVDPVLYVGFTAYEDQTFIGLAYDVNSTTKNQSTASYENSNLFTNRGEEVEPVTLPVGTLADSSTEVMTFPTAHGLDDSYVNQLITIGAETVRILVIVDTLTLNVEREAYGTASAHSGVASEVNASVPITLEYHYDDSLLHKYSKNVSYVFTVVSEYGEESGPCPATDIAYLDPSLQATLTQFGVHQGGKTYEVGDAVFINSTSYDYYRCIEEHYSGAFDPTKWELDQKVAEIRVYRTVVTNTSVEYFYVTSLYEGTTSFLDNVTDNEISELLGTSGWEAPPEGLSGLISIGNFLIGFVDRDIYFSVPNYPHAWKPLNIQSVDTDIVALSSLSETSFAILTTAEPYIGYGANPATVALEKTSYPQACVNSNAVISNGGGCYYASPDGLVFLTAQSYSLVSENVFSQQQWVDLDLDTVLLTIHDQHLFLFTTIDSSIEYYTKVYSLDLRNNQLIVNHQLASSSSAVYVDLEDDSLYFFDNGVLGNQIYKLSYSELSAYYFHTKDFVFGKKVEFNSIRVLYENLSVFNSLFIDIYADDVKVVSNLYLTNSSARKLPKLPASKRWSIKINSFSSEIKSIELATSMGDLR